tara:strand:- start:64 stop:714 length:651 start_codon:yes stop_codon:yes gene_type:complete
MNEIKVCVFDWDGTLVDSEKHIVDSLTYAAEKLALPSLSYEVKKDIIGLSMHKALETLYPVLSMADIEKMRMHYGEYFFSVPQNNQSLFNLVEKTLADLKSKGYKLAVATGKSRNGLDKALVSTGLKRFFDIERCADETRSKPDPLMLSEIADYYGVGASDMLMVGDTEFDLGMASNFGSPSLGVSYGVHEVSRLEKYKPLGIIDCISEIHRYLDL